MNSNPSSHSTSAHAGKHKRAERSDKMPELAIRALVEICEASRMCAPITVGRRFAGSADRRV